MGRISAINLNLSNKSELCENERVIFSLKNTQLDVVKE